MLPEPSKGNAVAVSLKVWERSDKLSVDTEEGAEKKVSEDENHNQG